MTGLIERSHSAVTPESQVANYLTTWRRQAADRANSFPAFMYTSDQVYQLERTQFFHKNWIYVGHISQLDGPGSYFTTSIAETPLLIVCDRQGTLRAFHNVCTHRAAPVALDSGSCHRFICPYHAWTFDLEGNLRGTPDFETYVDFHPDEYALSSIQIDTWGPFIFVNVDPDAAPLSEQLNEIPGLFNDYHLSEWVRVHAVDYYTDTNWKLYVENNAENYHEPIVHKSSYGTGQVSWNNSYNLIQCESRHHYYLQFTPYAPNSDEAKHGFQPGLFKDNLPERLMQGTSVMSFWPNFAWIICPTSAIIYTIDPQGAAHTRIRWEWLVPNTPEAQSAENLDTLIQLYDRVQQEDLNLLPDVQRGIMSPGYVRGPLSPTREVGVHRFQEILMEYLTGDR
jgi:choline monooxygenase